ncbi:MAG: membrane protein insertase YidC [Muribaculaceae bacterium]|nr:membrane protein insertase YidC [Muribaculaceae bacterium]
MDKNTVIGMLLMFAVIIGFMYCQSNNNKDAKQGDNKQSENTTNNKHNEHKDSLSQNDWATLSKLVSENDSSLVYGGVNIQQKGEKLIGTVKTGNSTISIDSVNTNVNAVKEVREAIKKYTNAQMFSGCLKGENKTITLKNDSLNIEISTKGGMITRATLNGYKAYHSQEDYKNNNSVPVELVSPGNNEYSFILNNLDQSFDTKDFYFVPENQNDSSVTMSLVNISNNKDAKWSIRYTLVKGTYMVRMEILQQNMDKIMHNNISSMNFHWRQKMQRQEAGKQFEERNSALYWKLQGDNDVSNLSESGEENEKVTDKVKWIAAKSQFFSTILIANDCFSGDTHFKSTAYNKDKDGSNYEKYLKDVEINTGLNYSYSNAAPASFYFYFGPNRYDLLSSYDQFSKDEDLHLTRLVSLGWKLFRWINSGIIMPVFNWLCKTGWSLGIVILILTILLKLVLWPLTYKSYMSQAKMKILQPDIQAINEKYPDQEDAMKKQQKIMELYKQAGANPMGGCLPMLLQMPFLIAMFWFFPSSIDLRGQSFLWAPDLSAPDALISLPFSIPFLGDHLSIFCLLMTITNIAYTYVNMQSQSSSSMPGMKWMMYLMPIMFLVFFNTYAAGLSYYYFVSLLITILQTFLTRMMVKEDKVRAVMAENAKKPKKKSGFMARLEEAQRRQQQALKEQQKRNNSTKRRR